MQWATSSGAGGAGWRASWGFPLKAGLQEPPAFPCQSPAPLPASPQGSDYSCCITKFREAGGLAPLGAQQGAKGTPVPPAGGLLTSCDK